jgi:hypothetical protein
MFVCLCPVRVVYANAQANVKKQIADLEAEQQRIVAEKTEQEQCAILFGQSKE